MAVILAEVTLSLFAVFGLYATVRLFCIYLFAPKEAVIALVIDHDVTKERAEWLLYHARDCTFAISYRRIVVMIDNAVEHADEMMDLFTSLGAVCWIKKD